MPAGENETPTQVTPAIEAGDPAIMAPRGHHYQQLTVNDNARVHVGDLYNYITQNNAGIRATTLDFCFGIPGPDSKSERHSAFVVASKNRLHYSSRKRPLLSSLMDHQDTYKSYTNVRISGARTCLVRIARSFARVDALFAALFAVMVKGSDRSVLKNALSSIRSEIAAKQRESSATGVSNNESVYLGDLGHHCENLLEEREEYEPSDAREFKVTHGTDESLIQYLEDGFEIPYWSLILDAFSTFRSNSTALGGDLVAMALYSMRSDVRRLRCELHRILSALSEEDKIIGIVHVIDKRITILSNFTDRVTPSIDDDDDTLDTTLLLPADSPGTLTIRRQLPRISRHKVSTSSSASSDLLVIVPLVLLTIIGASVPFTLGFKVSTERGTTQDADFWYNISSSIFAIMANLVMIIQLSGASRFTGANAPTWIWSIVGICCAIASGAIYPFCNTAWSSLLPFVASGAAFGATLSCAMAVGGFHSVGEEGTKKSKVE